MRKNILSLFALLLATSILNAKTDTLRVLAIGNSFSEDAVEQNLHEIARADGKCAIIGNLYIGGCPLDKHANNIKNDSPAYRYRHIDQDGTMTTTQQCKLSFAIKDEKWDVVTIQQASPNSGQWKTYEPYLGEIIQYIKEHTSPQTKIMFHQTWAYSIHSTHPGFKNYNYSYKEMYDSISFASGKAAQKYNIEVIPSGTAIQNARGTRLRDNFYRDGYHLSHACGRYLAACTWYMKLFGRDVRGNLYRPVHLTAEQATICQCAAAAAIDKPFEVSKIGFGKPKGNYVESRVPKYELPDPLQGGKISNSATWEAQRGELLELFAQEMYGKAPEKVKYIKYEVSTVKEDALDGLATRKEVLIRLDEKNRIILKLLIYLPNGVEKAPIFLGMNFFGNHTITEEEDVALPTKKDLGRYGDFEMLERGSYAYRWPLKKILEAGYGVACFNRSDIDPDFDDSATKGVQSLYPRTWGKACGPDQWGSIASWAWGLSRAMDYLCTDSAVDASKVALIGHSRLAKAALWAAANDTRFALVCANESGCGGAAISRRAFGETVGIINRSFPHWFCDNFKKYSENESLLPFDQHQLLALIAPRPICVGSAKDDLWSDPKGEYEGLMGAKPVYALYGHEDRLHYHIRDGKHELLSEDWEAYLKVADLYFK